MLGLIVSIQSADMKHLYKDCVLYDKLQCLPVLSAIKRIKSTLDN